MATSSHTHNFIINDKDNAERFAAALNTPKIKKTNVKTTNISGADNVRILVKKWERGNRNE